MNLLKNMKIGKKLIVIMLLVSLVPLLIMSLISYTDASNALEQDSFAKLTAIRNIKANQIDNFFEQKNSEIAVISETATVTKSLPLFTEAFKRGTNSVEWKEAELEYGPVLADIADEFGYYDLFLIDTSGNIVYTVAKEADFSTNLKNGKYSASNLAMAYNQGTSKISTTDIEMYEPSAEPAMFIAAPVYSSGKEIGVLAFQISIHEIDTIMNEKSGLGETGETYLVGEDKLMRSDSRFEQDSTVLVKEVNTLGVTEALAGKEDTKIFNDYRGVSVLSSYTLIEYENFNWALLSEIDESEAMTAVSTLRNIYIISLIVSSLIVVYIAYYFARTITKPIEEIVDITEKIASGDLTVTIENDSQDETGMLAKSIRTMQDSLKDLIGEILASSSLLASTAEEISASSEEISSATTEISDSIMEISKGATIQSSKSEDTAKSMFDLTETVQDVANNSQKAADNANESNELINTLGTITEDLLSKMDNIKMTSSESAEAIMELDGKSKQIGEIVNLITSIADQTNLLALNAAIEAARAGEHGRGFAVVADEVRKLAENSGNAAKQIADLIHEIQVGTNNAVASMEHGTEEVSNGANALNEAATMIKKVVESGSAVATMVQDIAAAAQEQSASIQEISAAIDEVASITQESASGTENTTAAIEQQSATMEELAQSAQVLSGMAENLTNIISRFKLDDEKIQEQMLDDEYDLEKPDMSEYTEPELDMDLDKAESILI